MNTRKRIIYNGRQQDRFLLLHEWFRESIPNLKEGWTIGVPVKEGIAIFEFKGIQKPKTKIKFCAMDEVAEDTNE